MSALLTPPAPELQPVDWRTIDDACFDWIALELKDIVAVGGIIWENQSIAQPAYPYVSLLRDPESDEGGIDERRRRTVDADGKILGQDPSAGAADANEEITYQPVRWTLAIQVHATPEAGGNDPACNPMFLAGKLKRSLGKTSVVDRLGAAGVALVNPEDIVDVSLEENGEWTSRAALDVVFRTASVMTETASFIDKAELKSETLGVDILVDAS